MKTVILAVGLSLAFAGIAYAMKIKKPVVNMKAIAIIESHGNPHAHNPKTGATGKYQITPICLMEYNQNHKCKFHMRDMYDPDICFAVADWYMNERIPELIARYGFKDSVENRLIAYNAGVLYLRAGGEHIPSESKKYIIKYRGLTHGHKKIVG